MRVDLDELERLEKEAFCAPWDALSMEWGEEGEATGNWFAHGPTHERHECEECDGVGWCDPCAEDNEEGAMNDAKLLATTRNALPALISELRAAREVVSRAQVLCAWNVNEDAEWKWMRDALAQYETATKGDG